MRTKPIKYRTGKLYIRSLPYIDYFNGEPVVHGTTVFEYKPRFFIRLKERLKRAIHYIRRKNSRT